MQRSRHYHQNQNYSRTSSDSRSKTHAINSRELKKFNKVLFAGFTGIALISLIHSLLS